MNSSLRMVVLALFVVTGGARQAHAEGLTTEGDHTLQAAAPDRPVHMRARQAEREYRHRLARLKRLRLIAFEGDAMGRLADLDALYDRLRAGHDERLDQIMQSLDAAGRDQLEAQLTLGRGELAWVREHRENVRELWAEHHRSVARHKRRQATRDRTSHRPDARQADLESRWMAQSRRTDAAERLWNRARERAVAETGDRRVHESYFKHNVHERWNGEARQYGRAREARLTTAARRQGLLPLRSMDDTGLPPPRRLPLQRQVDLEVGAGIKSAEADVEFERLREEIMGPAPISTVLDLDDG